MIWDGKRVWFTYAFKIFLSSEFSFAASVESLSSTLNCWPILYDHDDDLFFPAIMIMNSLFLYTSPYKLLTQMRIRILHELTVSMKHQLLQLSKHHLPPSLCISWKFKHGTSYDLLSYFPIAWNCVSQGLL